MNYEKVAADAQIVELKKRIAALERELQSAPRVFLLRIAELESELKETRERSLRREYEQMATAQMAERELREARAILNTETEEKYKLTAEILDLQGRLDNRERELQDARERIATLEKTSKWLPDIESRKGLLTLLAAERKDREQAEALLNKVFTSGAVQEFQDLVAGYFANRDKEQGCSRCGAIAGSKHSPECEAGCM